MIKLEYRQGVLSRGKSHFLPLLQTVERYPFPKPLNCLRLHYTYRWLKSKITSFTGDKFLKYVEVEPEPEIHQIWVDNASQTRLNLYIGQEGIGSSLLLRNIHPFLDNEQTKSLFLNLIQCHVSCYDATCGKDISALYGKNFSYEDRSQKLMLTWIQYLSREVVEKWGGFVCFESNPYVQTQRIHNGLLVQVGDNPEVFETPEGKTLLVNAINALPLIKQ
ncbi:MAG: hypothetical protein RLZZ292_430 [Bacteroidota bacterium]|jgi:hypothetical protein